MKLKFLTIKYYPIFVYDKIDIVKNNVKQYVIRFLSNGGKYNIDCEKHIILKIF